MASALAALPESDAFLERTSEKLALCKRGLNVISKVLAVLQEDVYVDTQSIPPSLRFALHDLTITMVAEVRDIGSLVTQLSQQCQTLIDVILQVSMDLPTFLQYSKLQHLQGNFVQVTTVQQFLKLDNPEGEMKDVHRRRLEREVGKIRVRMESEVGLSEITQKLNRLQEMIMKLITSCLDKLKECVSVSSDNKEEAGKTWWVYDTLPGRWLYNTFLQGSSNSEDTFTTRHRKLIEWIAQEEVDQLPTPCVDEVTPNLAEFLLKKDLQTLSSFKDFIAKTRSQLLKVSSSVGEFEQQAMDIARSLHKHYELK